MKRNLKNKQKGITLIALVITIIVLLILAGISIAMLTGENGLLTKATKSEQETKKASAKEKIQLAIMSSFEKDGAFHVETFKTEIQKQGGKVLEENDETIVVEIDGWKATIAIKTGDIKEFSKVEENEVNPTPVEFSMAYGRIEVIWLDTNNQVITSPSIPKLGSMTPVKWEGTTEKETQANDTTWYDYRAKTGKEDNLESRWANAKNDGSYFVWIPRYAYRITYYASSESDQITGYCDGDGIKEVDGTIRYALKEQAKTVTSKGKTYLIHPAFTNGTDNHFKNGEWDRELSGIWVGKYESSRSNATASSQGNATTLKVVPNVQRWGGIDLGNSYTTAYNYDRNKESHLMKNSEWGAVVYLAHSQYGRNGKKIDNNNSSSFITGNGSGSISASPATGITNAYHTEIGARASTTGNIYGIYDLSGGAYEQLASYIANGSSRLNNGASFTYKTADAEAYKTKSTKYATIYPHDASNNSSGINNYSAYKNAHYGYGDAILEVSTESDANTSWFEEPSSYVGSNAVFFIRGGHYDSTTKSGIFNFAATEDGGYQWAFRVILVCD